jgi:hypothetical protein
MKFQNSIILTQKKRKCWPRQARLLKVISEQIVTVFFSLILPLIALASDVARGTATAATTSSASSSDTSEFCSEEKIQALVSLGVSREGAKELLIAARGNVDVAAAMLFT